MHRRVANADETELLAREFLDRSQGHLQLIRSHHILARIDFNGDNLPLIPGLKLRPEALIHPFAFALESMNMVMGWHLTHSILL